MTDVRTHASQVPFDKAGTSLLADRVQGALAELDGDVATVVAYIDSLESRIEELEQGHHIQSIPIACSDETTPLVAGTATVTFRMPFGFTLTAVRASLTTAQSSGSILTIDVNAAGVSILSTKLTIDNGERTSSTAATAAVISTATLGDDVEITIDVDQLGNGTAAGLKVYLIGYIPAP